MASLDVGTLCMKVSGREAGKICTIVKKIDKAFVMISGPKLVSGIKRRRCNIEHLEPTEIKLDIKEDASDEELIDAYKKSSIVTKFNLKLPSAGELKAVKEKAEAKVEVKPKKETKKTKTKEEKKK